MEKEQSSNRQIDKNVESTVKNLKSRFVLVSTMKIRTWKAILLIVFVAGFSAAMIWATYNAWHTPSFAIDPIVKMYSLTENEAHKTGDAFATQIILDTSSQNIVAQQVVASFDPMNVQIVSIDASASDFPNEVFNKLDIQNNKIMIAAGKPTPGVNSFQAKIATINIKALADFNGAGISLKLSASDISDGSAAIIDDGKGTNVLSQVDSKFTNPALAADTIAPIRTDGLPTGTLPIGTFQTILTLTTNEKATCKFSLTSGTPYASMTSLFNTSDGIHHTASISDLKDGMNYDYYVRCADYEAVQNVNNDDYIISFFISSQLSSDTAVPVISNGKPSGILPYGTKSATISVATNINAACRYATTAGINYSSMTKTLSTSNGLAHTALITRLKNSKTYKYYIRCSGSDGNVNQADYIVSFSISKSR